MLKFTWDLETTNENFIKLIDSDDFGGFSPELNPINKPLYGNKIGVDKQGKEILERFYRSGDLEWAETAILSKSQKPGFVGANEYQLETFEAILIEKIEEEKPAVEEPKETFSKEITIDFVRRKFTQSLFSFHVGHHFIHSTPGFS